MRGSIEHRPDRPKPWKARLRTPAGGWQSKSFGRRGDAQRWLNNQLSAQDRREWIDARAGTIRYGEHAKAWLAGLHGLKPKTVAGYESLLRSRVLPTFERTELRKITPAMVRTWVAKMAEDVSADRVRQAVQVLRASLDVAVSDRILARNPAEGVRLPPVRPRRQQFLTAGLTPLVAERESVR